MSATQPHLFVELPDGWSGKIDIRQTAGGRYAGVAEFSLGGLQRGVLVFMQQPSHDAALARVRLRASQFARERLSLAGSAGTRPS